MNYPNITVKPHLLPLTNRWFPYAPYAPLLTLHWPKLQATSIKSNGMQKGSAQTFLWTIVLSLQIFANTYLLSQLFVMHAWPLTWILSQILPYARENHKRPIRHLLTGLH